MRFTTPAIALVAATKAAAFVPNSPARSEVALASYLDDLGASSAPQPHSGNYLDGLGSGGMRKRRDIVNRGSNGYLNTLSAGGGSGAAVSWGENKWGDERIENRSTVLRMPVDEVVEERREVVEDRREAVVADGTMEREIQAVKARNIGRKEGSVEREGECSSVLFL